MFLLRKKNGMQGLGDFRSPLHKSPLRRRTSRRARTRMRKGAGIPVSGVNFVF